MSARPDTTCYEVRPDRSGNLSARYVLAVMIGARRGRVSERKLRRESLPIANGARESCAASRLMESSALSSSKDLRFDVVTLDDRQDAQRTRTGGHDHERH